MSLKAGYKGFKTLGNGLEYNNQTGHLFLNGESDITLDNLKDVEITQPLDGDILVYDSTTEKWYNEQIDSDPVEDSAKPVSSGGVYAALQDVDEQKADNSVIAPVENGTTVSQSYAVGSHAIRNGAFITWVNAKAQGETIDDANDYTSGDLGNMIIFRKYAITDLAVTAGSYADISIPVLTGYKRFMAQAYVNGAGTSYDFTQSVVVSETYGDVSSIKVHNRGATDRTWSGYYSVIYIKSDSLI